MNQLLRNETRRPRRPGAYISYKGAFESEQEPNLIVKKSTIPNAGDGLFTVNEIEQDKVLGKYGGGKSVPPVPDGWYSRGTLVARDYVIHLKALGTWVDGAECIYGKMNDGGDRKNISIEGDGTVRADRKIRAGEELLTKYGHEYWYERQKPTRRELRHISLHPCGVRPGTPTRENPDMFPVPNLVTNWFLALNEPIKARRLRRTRTCRASSAAAGRAATRRRQFSTGARRHNEILRCNKGQ